MLWGKGQRNHTQIGIYKFRSLYKAFNKGKIMCLNLTVLP